MCICVQKSKAETDAWKGQVAQLEKRIAVDSKEKECEMEELVNKLMQKTEVSVLLSVSVVPCVVLKRLGPVCFLARWHNKCLNQTIDSLGFVLCIFVAVVTVV